MLPRTSVPTPFLCRLASFFLFYPPEKTHVCPHTSRDVHFISVTPPRLKTKSCFGVTWPLAPFPRLPNRSSIFYSWPYVVPFCALPFHFVATPGESFFPDRVCSSRLPYLTHVFLCANGSASPPGCMSIYAKLVFENSPFRTQTIPAMSM